MLQKQAHVSAERTSLLAFPCPSVAFPFALGADMVLDSSDEDENRTVKTEPAAASRPNKPDAAEVIEISSEEDGGAEETPKPLPAFLKAMWRDHEGHGTCTGSNELPCCFGKEGKAANAGPDGRCDLCSGTTIRMLRGHPYAYRRLTFLLKQLHGKPLLHALVRIKLVLGPQARDLYKERRRAALRHPAKRGRRSTA